eukprot:SAG31_NODE_4444_length_3225_cov_2.086052_7_plen_93_part_00
MIQKVPHIGVCQARTSMLLTDCGWPGLFSSMLSAEVLQLTYGVDSALDTDGNGPQNHHDALHSGGGGTVVGNLSAVDRELAAEIAEVGALAR